jgi:SWI/SNF-related matrix-associated actin-dependent regulator of chromatin subfamily A member 5
MYPDIFTAAQKFDDCFDLAHSKVDKEMLDRAHYLLRPFILRRLKREVEGKLPPKKEVMVTVPLSEAQAFWYKRLLMKVSLFAAVIYSH